MPDVNAAPRAVQQASNTSVAAETSAANKAADQAQQNQQAQQVDAAADQAKIEQSQKPDIKMSGLSTEFMSAFSSVVHEGYETTKVPQNDSSASTWSDNRGQENQRDLQVVREFVREANRLFADQKMEVSQMIHRIKADQGGVFWNKLQSVLQKGLSPQQAVVFQKLDKDAGDIKKKFGSPEIPVGEKAGEAGKAVRNPAGQALAEMLKAEANPTTQIEHMLVALQILQREGMKDSSQKLLSYLKQRWGLSDDELQRFLADHNLPYYLGPMPRRERSEKVEGTFWYPLLALVAVPIGMLAGMDFVWALVLGVALTGFFLILTAQNRK